MIADTLDLRAAMRDLATRSAGARVHKAAPGCRRGVRHHSCLSASHLEAMEWIPVGDFAVICTLDGSHGMLPTCVRSACAN